MAKKEKKHNFPPPETALEQKLLDLYKEEMIAYVSSEPGAYDEALQLALQQKQPYSWRSAWMIRSCSVPNDPRLKEYITPILQLLPKVHAGQQREFLTLLLNTTLNEDQEGLLYEFCINCWTDLQNQSGTRYKCFLFMLGMAKKYRDLKQEIKLVLDKDLIGTLSPGIKRAVVKRAGELELI